MSTQKLVLEKDGHSCAQDRHNSEIKTIVNNLLMAGKS